MKKSGLIFFLLSFVILTSWVEAKNLESCAGIDLLSSIRKADGVAYSLVLCDLADSNILGYVKQEIELSTNDITTLVNTISREITLPSNIDRTNIVESMLAISAPSKQVSFKRDYIINNVEGDIVDNFELTATPTFIDDVGGVIELQIHLRWTASQAGSIDETIRLHALKPRVIAVMHVNDSESSIDVDRRRVRTSRDVAVILTAALIQNGIVLQ